MVIWYLSISMKIKRTLFLIKLLQFPEGSGGDSDPDDDMDTSSGDPISENGHWT